MSALCSGVGLLGRFDKGVGDIDCCLVLCLCDDDDDDDDVPFFFVFVFRGTIPLSMQPGDFGAMVSSVPPPGEEICEAFDS
mmetsp:Transcript_4607/g.8984  ORF Transcript_4607/g.8984 Transcript_4607/m.8984 type:complete len:81 (-) Transcript_4607:64-306(-)